VLGRNTGNPWLGACYFVALTSQAFKRGPRLYLTGDDGKASKTRKARIAISDRETHLMPLAPDHGNLTGPAGRSSLGKYLGVSCVSRAVQRSRLG
jgi:hypothetical protein